MIPGNRPEDLAEEAFWTALEERLAAQGVAMPEGDDWTTAIDIARSMAYEAGYGDGQADAALEARNDDLG